jgi:polysaccharide export outer membrane protein
MRLLKTALGVAIFAVGISGCSILPGLNVSVDEDPEDEPLYAFVPITIDEIRKQRVRKSAPLDPGFQLPSVGDARQSYSYRIGPGDVVSIIVWDHPELTSPLGEFQDLTTSGRLVDQEGMMFYPHVGAFKVAGLTVDEIRSYLVRGLARVITAPQVDVRVAAFRSRRAYVTGEVTNPCYVPMTDVPQGVLDAINICGGLKETASRRRATLIRGSRTYPIDLLALLTRGDTTQNVLLEDGDVLQVTDSFREKVFLMGEVKAQNAYPIQRGFMTLTEALSVAGGLDVKSANDASLFVFRSQGDTTSNLEPYRWTPVVYAMDLESAQSMLLAEQFELQPRDIVYVSPTSFAKYNRVINELLPTIQGIFQLNALYEAANGDR